LRANGSRIKFPGAPCRSLARGCRYPARVDEQLSCAACGSTDGAQVRPVPLKTVACDACWTQASAGFPSREPERPDYGLVLGQIQAGSGAGNGATCRYCGAHGTWHRTERGSWMIIEPGNYPTGQIPAGKRWRVAGDGTAVNLRRGNPADVCRISHFDVCPSKSAPSDGKLLLAIWRQHHAGMS